MSREKHFTVQTPDVCFLLSLCFNSTYLILLSIAPKNIFSQFCQSILPSKNPNRSTQMVAIMLLILLYVIINVLTGVLLYLIIKFLKSKPFGHQYVTDHLSIDFVIVLFASVSIYSASIIIRELTGPLGPML